MHSFLYRSQEKTGPWKQLALGLLAASALLTAPLAMAETPWQAAHPARAEVLQRANHLDHRGGECWHHGGRGPYGGWHPGHWGVCG